MSRTWHRSRRVPKFMGSKCEPAGPHPMDMSLWEWMRQGLSYGCSPTTWTTTTSPEQSAKGDKPMGPTYIQLINAQLDSLRETKRKHSSTLSSMEQEMRRLAASLEVLEMRVNDLRDGSLSVHQPSGSLKSELSLLLEEAGCGDWTDEKLWSEVSTLLSTRYCKERGLL